MVSWKVCSWLQSPLPHNNDLRVGGVIAGIVAPIVDGSSYCWRGINGAGDVSVLVGFGRNGWRPERLTELRLNMGHVIPNEINLNPVFVRPVSPLCLDFRQTAGLGRACTTENRRLQDKGRDVART